MPGLPLGDTPAAAGGGDPLAALVARAAALAQLGRWADLLPAAAAVLAREPTHAAALGWTAQAELGRGGPGAWRRALAAADALVAADPEDEWGHRLRGAALLARPFGARRALGAAREAVRLAPTVPEAHDFLAQVYLALQRPRQAREPAEAFARLAPASPAAHALLARVAVAARQWADAERHARRALARDAEHPDAQDALARALLARGQSAEAVDAAYGAARAEPSGDRTRALRQVAYDHAVGPMRRPAFVTMGVLVVVGAFLHKVADPTHRLWAARAWMAALGALLVVTIVVMQRRSRAAIPAHVQEAVAVGMNDRAKARVVALFAVALLAGMIALPWTLVLLARADARPSTAHGWATYAAVAAAAVWLWRRYLRVWRDLRAVGGA